MRRHAAAAALAVALIGAGGGEAQELRCGGSYTVAQGDTLATIAARHYGDIAGFREIYERNRAVIGASPDTIEIGQVLEIPCLDEPGRAAAREAPAPEPAAAPAPVETAAAPARSGGGAVLLTSDGQPPLTGADLPGGGLYTEMVTRALARAAPGLDFEIVFMSDRPARMEDLLPPAGYDLGFPWIRPDCEAGAQLSRTMRERCTRYEFSDPFFEVRIGYFTGSRSDYREATSAEQLFGARICRPGDLFTGDLEAADLVEPNISLVTSGGLDYCIEALRYGEVDVVTAEVARVRATLDRLGYRSDMVELEALSNEQTLRVAGPRGRPRTRAYIAALNDGLQRLRETGEWFAIVSRHAALGGQPTN